MEEEAESPPHPFQAVLRGFVTLIAFALWATGSLAETSANQMRDRAFEGAQWVMATGAARAVANVNARLAVGDGPLSILIRERQDTEEALRLADRTLRNAIKDGADPAELRRSTDALRGVLADLDQRIRDEFPEYAEMASPRPMTVQDVQMHLRAREGLVLFLTAQASTYVWVISKTDVHWHRAEVGRNMLSDMIRDLRIDLDPTGALRAAVPLDDDTAASGVRTFDVDTAFALYDLLLDPAAEVLQGVDHLMAVKDGPLSSLPLAVLLTRSIDPATDMMDYRDFPWFLRDVATSTLPSVSSLLTIDQQNQADAVERQLSFLGIGNPTFDDSQDGVVAGSVIVSRTPPSFFDESGTRLEAIRKLPPLPGTERELQQIAALFPPDAVEIITGPAATEAAVKSARLSSARILSFATHGLVAGDFTGLGEPALAFAPPATTSALDDGLLTASEASTLDLAADWVILSACNTAAGDGTPGAKGLSGLARAFLFAGARSMLVSHWPVRDDVAGDLTVGLLQFLTEDPSLPRSEALRKSILEVIGDERDPTLAHPSAWAPFVIVGDGGV